MSCTLEPVIDMCHWSADALCDSCQLTTTWMSILVMKLNTDCIRESSFNMTRGVDEDIETRSLKF